MRLSSSSLQPLARLVAVAAVLAGCASGRPNEVRVPAGEVRTLQGLVFLFNLCPDPHSFDYATDRPDFLSFEPVAPLEVPPNENSTVDSKFDASGLSQGEYDATITVDCSDCPVAKSPCTQDKREIPVRMIVYDPFVVVTVHVYSGRPNPTFRIEDKGSIDQLIELLQRAEAAAGPPARPGARLSALDPGFAGDTVMPARLGYGGVSVEVPDDHPRLPRRVLVFRDAVQAVDGTSVFLADPGGEIELFLLDAAVERGAISELLRGAILLPEP